MYVPLYTFLKVPSANGGPSLGIDALADRLVCLSALRCVELLPLSCSRFILAVSVAENGGCKGVVLGEPPSPGPGGAHGSVEA